MKKIRALFTKKVLIAIVVLGALVIVMLYALVYLKYSEKTLALESSNGQLKNSIRDLKVYYDNMETYEEQIELASEEIQKLLEPYPAGARPEDVLMLAVDIQENSVIQYSNINMAESELVYEVTQDIVEGAGIEGLENKIEFKKKHATYVNLTNYENLKECIEQIYASSNRIGIQQISYSKHENSNILDGTIDLSFYYATGTGKKYVSPEIEEYPMGAENIFQ